MFGTAPVVPDGIVRTAAGLYVVRDDVCLSRQVEAAGTLELPANLAEIHSFAAYIPIGGTVVDAGACLGDHTVTYARLVGETGHVFAFEPHPLTYAALALNMIPYRQVISLPYALSDASGAQSFCSLPNIGASFLTDGGEFVVSCCRLDDALLDRLTRCDVIHLDAEGWEPRILHGAAQILERFRPVLIVEVCDQHLRRAGSSEVALLAQLDALGYDVRPIPEHTDPALRDVLCLPRVV